MSKIKVLFFAADPLSIDGKTPRLRLDEDIRRTREKVRAAEHRDALDFKYWPAARTDDLIQALNQTSPQVVHFSGHGGRKGLVLASADGMRPHTTDAAALRQLFEAFRGEIRVVVLNACFSLPQAKAIADVVGCAIGTRGTISDEAAITFGASFYRAIAFGKSVQTAYDQARAALALEHFEDHECPELVSGPNVDPSELVLVSPGAADPVAPESAQLAAPPRNEPPREEYAPLPPAGPRKPPKRGRLWRWGGMTAGAATFAAVVFVWIKEPPGEVVCRESRSPVAALIPRGLLSSSAAPATRSSEPGAKSLAESDLASARDLYDVGNFSAALPLFERAAAAGNTEAMAFVGDMHLNGQGTVSNPKRALTWLDKAKKTRDPRGMNALGTAYERGEGVRRSNRWALHWYRESAEKDFAPALINIGEMYEEGLGRPVNHEQALACYEKAVALGSVDAIIDVARFSQQGLAGRADLEETLRLYRAAADRGSARAMVEIGLMYQNGNGVSQDPMEAFSWFQKGAAAGSAEAMNNLGVLYQNGWGVPQDQAEADRWFRRAAEAGSDVGAANLRGAASGDE